MMPFLLVLLLVVVIVIVIWAFGGRLVEAAFDTVRVSLSAGRSTIRIHTSLPSEQVIEIAQSVAENIGGLDISSTTPWELVLTGILNSEIVVTVDSIDDLVELKARRQHRADDTMSRFVGRLLLALRQEDPAARQV